MTIEDEDIAMNWMAGFSLIFLPILFVVANYFGAFLHTVIASEILGFIYIFVAIKQLRKNKNKRGKK